MIGITAAVAALFSLAGIVFRPSVALGLIIMSTMVYPEFMRLQIGPAAMSVPRLAAFAVLIKLVCMGRHRATKFHKVDKLVVLIWMWIVISALVTGGAYTQMIGRFFDTVVMYFVARYAIQSEKDVSGIFIPLALTAVLMGSLGVVESITTYSPYNIFNGFIEAKATIIYKGQEFRYGFLRAKGSSSVHIYFGIGMMILTGIAWSMRGFIRPFSVNFLILPIAFAGVLSSMSSGPWLAAIFLLFFNAYIMNISLIKPSLWLLVIVCVFLELGSNRHFYHLIEYIALSSETAWYRVRLLEVTFSNWREFWLFGTGNDPLVHWAAQLDGRAHLDIVNHYVLIGTYGGFVAMVMYVYSHYIAVKCLAKRWKTSVETRNRKLIFGLGATLIAMDAASLSVALFGPPLLLSHILLGMCISMSPVSRDSRRNYLNLGTSS